MLRRWVAGALVLLIVALAGISGAEAATCRSFISSTSRMPTTAGTGGGAGALREADSQTPPRGCSRPRLRIPDERCRWDSRRDATLRGGSQVGARPPFVRLLPQKTRLR